MKTVVFNNTNLREDEVEKRVTKVRAIIINEKGQAIVSKFSNGTYILPGGKIDKGETREEALQREISEELGIKIDISKIGTPFLKIKAYNAKYPDSSIKREINKLTETVFYEIHTEQQIDITKQKLGERETNSGLSSKTINLSILQYLVETNSARDYREEIFKREILTAIREFAKYKQEEQYIKNGR